MDITKRLSDCLDVANTASNEIHGITPGESTNFGERLHWLEMQLANVVNEMLALLADMESGISIYNLGFSNDGDLEDILEGFEIEISNLRGQIRSMMMAGKGRAV